MNRVIICSTLDRRELAILTRLAGFFALATLLAVAVQPPTSAITINMEYTDEGDPVPHDENPTWDPDGTILKAHFQVAKTIWESLLPEPGEYSFDFHWDNDLDDNQLGLYTPGIDEFIELNSNKNWFADPTPNDSVEFSFTQTVASGLTSEQRVAWFPGEVSPPSTLEVGFLGSGDNSPSLHPGFLASSGSDLLSVVLHEIGHALGIEGTEPGEYNIYPQHVGGVPGLLVAEDSEGGHLAGGNGAFWLMATSLPPGQRRLPSATDVLVIAEDQGINNVHLARVGRILAGDWSNTFAWIGGFVPDATQDAYVTQGGAVLLDVDASVKSLRITGGSTVDAQTLDLTSASDINFDGGSLAVGIGGSITANKIDGDPTSLTTTAFSLVRFNEFTRGTSSATSVTFNGSVGIGRGIPPDSPVTFNPSTLANWNIAQNLTVGDQRAARLVIDNGTWNVGGNLTIQGKRDGLVTLGSTVTIESAGALNVTGVVDINTNGELEYKNAAVLNATYVIRGGDTFIDDPPGPEPPSLKHTPGSRMTLYGAVSAGTATIDVEGGNGDGGPGGFVTFKGNSRALNAKFWTKPGIGGISLRISNPTVIAGTGGRVQFEDDSFASNAHFRNDGVNHHGASGSGGATYFLDDSNASDAVFDNYGSPMTGYTGAVPAPGGRTEFFNDSTAWTAEFNNHPGLGMGPLGAGITIFHGNSTADDGVFFNKGGVPGMQFGGATEFHDQATAGDATFINQRGTGLAQNPSTAGNTRFYGNSTAGTAEFQNKAGGGTTIFYDSSTAGDGTFVIEDGGSGVFGGHVVFADNSRGGTADLTIKPTSFSASIEFGLASFGFEDDAPNAEQAHITLENGSSAGVVFRRFASMGEATIDIGNAGGLSVRDFATAADASIRLRAGATATFTGTNNPTNFPTSAANADITLDGGSVPSGNGGALFFSSLSTAGDAEINIGGGTVSGAHGGQLQFTSGASAGNAVVTAGSGVAGAAGGRIAFLSGANGATARFILNAGAFIDVAANGGADIGSIEGAGAIVLGHAELRLGTLNTSTTISGPITGFSTNARFTKVGTGTLTLSGANTYTGLTKVNAGTLVITGSNPGPVEVNSGSTLKGIGTIGGTVTVNSGATFAPGNAGTSPNAITVGGLTMMGGSALEFELAQSTYDRIVTSGAAALAGILNVSFVGGFTPTAGSAFNLFDWGSVAGSFNTLNLATLPSGLSWNTSQLYTTGVLSIAGAQPGDFNTDGKVDAADYVVWRKNGGTQAQFNLWRGNFGNMAGSGSGVANDLADISVPEPVSLTVMLLAVAALFIMRRRAPV